VNERFLARVKLFSLVIREIRISMTPEQHTQFRKQLLALKEELIGVLATTADDIKPVALDQAAVGRVSRGDAMQRQQMALESSRRRELQLVSVDKALKRLDDQGYGICIDCDEEINVRRLEIDPTATRCIKCAEANSR
jgi:DnaK suppressor protein